jgi:hypothetical protein
LTVNGLANRRLAYPHPLLSASCFSLFLAANWLYLADHWHQRKCLLAGSGDIFAQLTMGHAAVDFCTDITVQ